DTRRSRLHITIKKTLTRYEKYSATIGQNTAFLPRYDPNAHLPHHLDDVLRVFLWLVWTGAPDARDPRGSRPHQGPGGQYDHCLGLFDDHRPASYREIMRCAWTPQDGRPAVADRVDPGPAGGARPGLHELTAVSAGHRGYRFQFCRHSVP